MWVILGHLWMIHTYEQGYYNYKRFRIQRVSQVSNFGVEKSKCKVYLRPYLWAILCRTENNLMVTPKNTFQIPISNFCYIFYVDFKEN